MDQNDTPIIVYTTWPDISSAKRIAGEIVGMRLAACVNITPGMISVYRWQGQQETSEEVVMIIKTRAAQLEAVVSEVEARHPYDTPAIVSWPATGGSAAYADWIAQMTSSTGN